MLTTLLFTLLASSNVQGSNQDWADARLNAKVSVRARMASLSDFAKTLARQSGVDFRVTLNLGDRKVCAYFKEEPLKKVMERTATLFDGEWIKERDAYRFSVPNRIFQMETDLLKKEALAQRAYAEKRVLNAIQVYKRYTLSEISDAITQLKDELAASKTDVSPQGKKATADLQARLDEWLIAMADYTIGCVLSQVESLEGFWEGRIIAGATAPVRGQPRLSDSNSGKGAVIRTEKDGNVASSGALELIRFSPVDGSLASHQQILFPNDAGGFKVMMSYARPFDDPYAGLREHPFHKLVDAWSTPVSELEKLPIMHTPLDEIKRKNKLDYPYPGQVATLAEQLEWLYDATGLPIIAEPFRRPVGVNAALSSAPNLKTWIGSFMSEDAFSGYFRVENGWLCFRQEAFWRLRTEEIPERILAPFEAKAHDRRALSFDEYGTLAAQLNDKQLQALKTLSGPDTVLLRFFSEPLADAGKALRVWGALDPLQKRLAASESGLPVSKMLPTQKQRYWDTLYDSVWEMTIVNTRLRNAALYGGDPELEDVLKFFVAKETYQKGSGVQFANLPQSGPDPFTGFRMRLGVSQNGSIGYWCRTDR